MCLHLLIASFQSVEPAFSSVTLTPDYSLESHAHDLPEFLATARSRHRRAKALLGKYTLARTWDDEMNARIKLI